MTAATYASSLQSVPTVYSIGAELASKDTDAVTEKAL